MLLQPPFKMAAAWTGRHFLVSFFSLSSAQNGGGGGWPPLPSALGLPRTLRAGLGETGSPRRAREESEQRR